MKISAGGWSKNRLNFTPLRQYTKWVRILELPHCFRGNRPYRAVMNLWVKNQIEFLPWSLSLTKLKMSSLCMRVILLFVVLKGIVLVVRRSWWSSLIQSFLIGSTQFQEESRQILTISVDLANYVKTSNEDLCVIMFCRPYTQVTSRCLFSENLFALKQGSDLNT